MKGRKVKTVTTSKNDKLIVAIVGKAGSGKDALARQLATIPTVNNIVSCTTRPMRQGEQEGKSYYFLTNEEFAEKVLNGDMLEATFFNGWHYGTMKSSLKEGINVGVFNPEGWDCLIEAPIPGVAILGYYLYCDDKERLLRQLNREDYPDVHEIIRRFNADEEDFAVLDPRLKILPSNNWNDHYKNYETIVQDIDDLGFKKYR